MNGRVRLQITVRHCDIAVTRLVSGIDDALGIREVTYAGVLQTVELVGVREAKSFSDFHPFQTESVDENLLGPWSDIMAKEIV